MRNGAPIAAKLGFCLVALALLIGATGGLALLELRQVNTAASDLRDVRVPATDTLGAIGINFMRQRVNISRLLTADTPEFRAEVTG